MAVKPTGTSARSGRATVHLGGRVRRSALVIAATTVAYYLAPIGEHLTATAIARLVLAAGALAVVVWQASRRYQEYLRGDDRSQVGLEGVATSLFILAVGFAAAYFALAQHAGQMVGASTRTDALYFSVTTLATVGYGDVHPAGQLARVVAMVQMLFDLVFVGTAISLVVTGMVANRQRQP